MKKIRPIIRKWFDCLINKNVMRKKPKIIRDKLKDKIINDICKLFGTKKEERKRKKQDEKIIKYNIEISGYFLNKRKKKKIIIRLNK